MKLMIASDIHGSAYWCRRMLDEAGFPNAKICASSDLDEQNDNELAEARPVDRGVIDYQSRDADRGRSGEQGVQKGGAGPIPRGYGEHEQEAPQQYDQQETQYDDPEGGLFALVQELPHRLPPLYVLLSFLSTSIIHIWPKSGINVWKSILRPH